MNVKPRLGASIDLIVLHDPEGANTAQELYNYLQHIDAGYHSLCDDTEEIICAHDDQVVEGAGGVNMRSLNLCFVPGRAAWTREQWLQHTPAIKRGAARAAIWSQLHGIPLVHLTHGQVATPGTKGVCTHGDVSAAGYSASEGHTDPGPNFPMDVFLTFARGDALPVPEEEYEDMIIEAPRRFQTDPNAPKCVSLDIPNKKFNLLNGCPAPTQGTAITTAGPIRGWYEIFTAKGEKRGFTIIHARNAAGKNRPSTFTWPT